MTPALYPPLAGPWSNPQARYGLEVVSGPAAEPLSLAEAKRHLRIDHTSEDDDVLDMIAAAREWAERVLNRAIVTQTLRATFRVWPAVVRLPRTPLQTVDTVEYVNADGALTALASSAYQAVTAEEPGYLVAAAGGVWPDTQRGAAGVLRVTYTAGYGGSDVTPRGLKQGLKLLLGHFWRNREAVGASNLAELPLGVCDVLSPYWVGWLY